MKNFLQTAFLLISFTSFAQNKFIEVEVQDTITLKPQTLQCNIILKEEIDFAIEENEQETSKLAAQENSNNELQDLKKTLEAKKYNVKPLDKSDWGMFDKMRFKPNGYSVIVNGITEVEKLKEALSKMHNVEILTTVLTYANEQKAEEFLIKKLLDKAKTRAAIIGTNSGLKVGMILEVKEGQSDIARSVKDFYSEIIKMGNLFRQDTGNYNGNLSKTFVVKFSAE